MLAPLPPNKFSRRKILVGMAGVAGMASTGFAAESVDTEAMRAEYRKWLREQRKKSKTRAGTLRSRT